MTSNELSVPASSLWVQPVTETAPPPQFLERLLVERPGFRTVSRHHADGHAEDFQLHPGAECRRLPERVELVEH